MLVTLRASGIYYILQLLTSQYTFLHTFAYILGLFCLFGVLWVFLHCWKISKSLHLLHHINLPVLSFSGKSLMKNRIESQNISVIFFINDKGTNNNLIMEKPQGHHFSQDTNDTPVGMHWGHNGTLEKNAWPETITCKTGQTQIGDHSIHQPVQSSQTTNYLKNKEGEELFQI